MLEEINPLVTEEIKIEKVNVERVGTRRVGPGIINQEIIEPSLVPQSVSSVTSVSSVPKIVKEIIDVDQESEKEIINTSPELVKEVIDVIPETKEIPVRRNPRRSMTIKGSEKIGRNELCSCGSKIKYKKCCLKKEMEQLEIDNRAQRAIESAEKKVE